MIAVSTSITARKMIATFYYKWCCNNLKPFVQAMQRKVIYL